MNNIINLPYPDFALAVDGMGAEELRSLTREFLLTHCHLLTKDEAEAVMADDVALVELGVVIGKLKGRV